MSKVLWVSCAPKRAAQDAHAAGPGDEGDDEIPSYSAGVQSDLMVEEDAAVEEFLRS